MTFLRISMTASVTCANRSCAYGRAAGHNRPTTGVHTRGELGRSTTSAARHTVLARRLFPVLTADVLSRQNYVRGAVVFQVRHAAIYGLDRIRLRSARPVRQNQNGSVSNRCVDKSSALASHGFARAVVAPYQPATHDASLRAFCNDTHVLYVLNLAGPTRQSGYAEVSAVPGRWRRPALASARRSRGESRCLRW